MFGVSIGLVITSLLWSLLYAVILLTPVLARLPGLSWTVDLRPVSFASINLKFLQVLVLLSWPELVPVFPRQ